LGERGNYQNIKICGSVIRLIDSLELFINTAFNCDNREVFAKLPDKSIDLIVTDPPYKDYQSNRPVAHDKVKAINESDFRLRYFLKESARVLKNGCHFYCWCDHVTFPNIVWEMERLRKLSVKKKSDNYLLYKNCLVWIKNNHGSGDLNGNWAPQHEFILYASKGKRNPLRGKRRSNVLFKDIDGRIEFYKKISNYKFSHGTAKPVEILKLILEASSQVGDLVFDPYAGSMSLGEACILMGRNYLLVEIDKEHFNTGEQRLEKLIDN
jgi:site-specific DNA-methyltransferase (adenine-specific)